MNSFFDRERQRVQQGNQALRDQIQRQSDRLQENGRRVAAGWTSPDATGTHTAVSPGATPKGLVRRWRRSHIGQARGVQQHSPRTNTALITSFRLETFDAHAGRRPGAPLRFRGQAAVGFAGEGDWVEAAGFRWGGTVRVRKAFNHSTGARYRRPLRRTAVIAGLALLGAGVTTGGAAALLDGAKDKVKPPVSTSTSLVVQESTTTTEIKNDEVTQPPFDIGNPNSRSLPPEHRGSTLGTALTKKLSDKAKAERRPWKDVVLVAVGPVTNLQPEARFDFLGKSEDMVERLQECLLDDGTWKACAEPVVGDSATLKAAPEAVRLAAWPKAPAVTDEALSCLLESKPDAKGKQWTGCAAAAIAGYYRSNPDSWKDPAPNCDDTASDLEFVTCVHEATSKADGESEAEAEAEAEGGEG